MRKLYAGWFFVFCLVNATGFGQKKIFTGYYIGVEGDSVSGIFPHYTQWNKSPATVDFITDNKQVTLTPENCHKFSIDSFDTYLSYKGRRMTNPINLQAAIDEYSDYGVANNFVPVTAFVRLIGQTGNLKMYVLNDEVRSNFYYRLNNDTLTELRYKTYYQNTRFYEIDDYRQQLKFLFNEEIEKYDIPANIANVKYAEESLRDLLNQLTPPDRIKRIPKNQQQGVVVAIGTSINFFEIAAQEAFYKGVRKFNSSLAPLITIGYLSPFKRNFGKFFIYPQMKFYSYKNTGEIKSNVATVETTYKTSLTVAPVLNFGINIKNSERSKFFGSFGGGILLLMGNKQIVSNTSAATNTPPGYSETPLSKLSYVVNLSTGLMLHNKYVLSAGYNFLSPVTNFSYYIPYHSSLQITVGYKL